MNLEIFQLDNSLPFNDTSVIIVEVENIKFYRSLIESFHCISEFETPAIEMRLYENNEEVNIANETVIITDILHFDFKQRVFITKIYKQLEKQYHNNKEIDLIADQLVELRQLIGIQLNDYDLPLQLNEEVKLSSLYKLFNVTIEVETESILDRLLLLIDLVAQLKIARIIILNNVRCYFVEQELLEVYKYALYKNIKLLLIEPIFKKGKLQYERKLQIDNDYIEFWQ